MVLRLPEKQIILIDSPNTFLFIRLYLILRYYTLLATRRLARKNNCFSYIRCNRSGSVLECAPVSGCAFR